MPGQRLQTRYDVVVAGARCAGASTAMLLAQAGLRVLVVDPLPRGRDTLSTHALMRGGVALLHRWGLLEAIQRAGTPAVRTTSFHYGDERIDIPIKSVDGVDALYAPRRTVLDPILVEAAEEAGAQVEHGLSVSDLIRGPGGSIRGAVISGAKQPPIEVHADLVIGADGVRSRVARLVGAPLVHSVPNTAAAIYGHWPGLGVEGYHWLFSPGISGGSIPTNDDHTCVFASVPVELFRSTPHDQMGALYHRTLKALDPELADDLAAASEVRLRAFPGLPGFIRQSVGEGWALVGDAGYFRDPLTAHGITDALREAELLTRAVLSGDQALAVYQPERDARVTGLLEVTNEVCAFEWDLDQVKALHLDLSREMNVGVDAIRALDEPAAVPAGDLAATPS